MITKQQAMDFIYNLSQITDVKLDLSKGILAAEEDSKSSRFYHYKAGMCKCSLEELVMFFIKGYLDSALLSNIPIPVDIDMLEVGQMYRVVYSNYWDELEEFTSKLIDIDYDRHTNYKLFGFSNDSIVNQGHIEEIYKVN